MVVRTNAEVTHILNDLIKTCREREQGYRTAQDGVASAELKRLFGTSIEQSVQFRRELERQLRQRVWHANSDSSLAEAAFRGWAHLKAAVTKGEDTAVLSECERGEDAALGNYRRALEAGLPAELNAVVARQARELENAHARVRTWRM